MAKISSTVSEVGLSSIIGTDSTTSYVFGRAGAKGSTKAEERGVHMNLLRSAMLMMQQLQLTMLIPLKILTQANGLLGILNYATI
jgi:hypothetical protein